jgi:hypothetical protein
MVLSCNFYENSPFENQKDATTKNVSLQKDMMVFKRKKSPFLVTFLFAPLFPERCNYNAMIEYVTIRKLKG